MRRVMLEAIVAARRGPARRGCKQPHPKGSDAGRALSNPTPKGSDAVRAVSNPTPWIRREGWGVLKAALPEGGWPRR